MFFGVFFLPAAFFDETFDEQVFARGEVDHPAVVMGDQRDMRNAADRDRIRDFELAVTEIRTACSQHESEIVRDMQKLAAVHAHADEQLRLRIGLERAAKILVFQETSDRSVPVFGRDVRDFLDRNKTAHVFPIIRS